MSNRAAEREKRDTVHSKKMPQPYTFRLIRSYSDIHAAAMIKSQ